MLHSSLYMDIKEFFLKVVNNHPEAIMFYTEASGDQSVKESFVKYLLKYRNINTVTNNVMIVSGTQQGLSLVASTFTGPKDLVMIESPSYTGAIDAFKSSGTIIKSLPTYENKNFINKLIEQCDIQAPKFIYLTPNYSNPIGYSLSKKERVELLELAEAFDFYIIEDDPWGELSTHGGQTLSIKSFDRNSRVIYIKGVSKILGAGYRVAALVASEDIVGALEKAKACADLGTPLLTQRLVSEILKSPLIDKHIEKIEKFIQKRIKLTVNLLKKNLNSEVKYSSPKGGFNVWITLPKEINTANLLFEEAYNNGIVFLPGAICHPINPKHNEIRISVSYLSEEDYEIAIEKLCKIINKSLDQKLTPK